MNYLSGMRSPQSNFTIAAEALKKLMRSHNDAELLVVGALQMEKIGLPESRLIRAAWIDFMDLPALLQNTWISVDPLVTNDYNRAKPHTRFIESAAFGVPLISTPTVDLQQHDVPGLFLVNDEREWLDALNALSDLDYYAQCSQALREYARDCCMAGNYVNDLVANWYNPFKEFKIDELTAPISEAC
jgi:glycosyltransferase involved in cell wall biosynthesis